MSAASNPVPPVPADASQALLQALFGLFRDLKSGLMAEMVALEALEAQADAPAVAAARTGSAAAPIAPFHLTLLRRCVLRPGQSQQELVQGTGRDKGQVARVVKELEAAGLLRRDGDAGDRRRLRLWVTAAGQERVQRFDAAERRLARRAFGGLSAATQARWTAGIGACRAALAVPLEVDPAAEPAPPAGPRAG